MTEADCCKVTAEGRLKARPPIGWLLNLLRFKRLSLHQIPPRAEFLLKRDRVYYIPLWLPIALAHACWHRSAVWDDVGRTWSDACPRQMIHLRHGTSQTEMAPFFAPVGSVLVGTKLITWALAQYDVDRDLLATVMQIESCGHPDVVSNGRRPRPVPGDAISF